MYIHKGGGEEQCLHWLLMFLHSLLPPKMSKASKMWTLLQAEESFNEDRDHVFQSYIFFLRFFNYLLLLSLLEGIF